MRNETETAVLSGQLYFSRCPEAGDVVLRDCLDRTGRVLARAGDILNPKQIAKLLSHMNIPPFLSAVGLDAASASALALYGSRFTRERADVISMLNEVVTDPAVAQESAILEALPSADTPLPWIMRLASLDITTQGHCLNVALLAGVIVRHLTENNLEAVEAAMTCGLLHDIGKLRIEREILEAKRSLTDAEFEHVKTHSRLGYEMLAGRGGILEQASLCALHHHVKQPGCGYPDDVDLSELSDLDLIVQFCDIFDALVTKRPYKNVMPPFEALRTVYNDFEKKIETRVATQCIHALQNGFIGAEVIMPDGSYGTIVDIIERSQVCKPVVKLRNSERIIKCDSANTEPVSIIGCS